MPYNCNTFGYNFYTHIRKTSNQPDCIRYVKWSDDWTISEYEFRSRTQKSFCCKDSTPWIITVLFLVYLGLAVIKLSSTSFVLVLTNHPIRASYSINTVF